MNELTLRIDCLFLLEEEFSIYILALDGIDKVKTNKESLEIYIKYDNTKISINRIVQECFLFLGVNRMPSLLAFDKHYKSEAKNGIITINSLCCEYCLHGMIEELLMYDGIQKASSDYDYINKKNVHINISYDEQSISKEKIRELEKSLNEY